MAQRLFILSAWEKRLDYWLLRANAAETAVDSAEFKLCETQFKKLCATLRQNGYEISTYPDRFGMRVTQ